MDLQLTPQQQQAIDAQSPRPVGVIDPRDNTPYLLVPEADYQLVRG